MGGTCLLYVVYYVRQAKYSSAGSRSSRLFFVVCIRKQLVDAV